MHQNGRTTDICNLHCFSDLGYLNKHGLFEICGRTSDLIIKGGVNIFPVEVEKVIAIVIMIDIRAWPLYG